MAALTEEQSMIRDQAKSWTTEQAPVGAFRERRDSKIETAFVPATWDAMSSCVLIHCLHVLHGGARTFSYDLTLPLANRC